ncbi:MAG: hypothetical protein ACE10F_02700 [Candidatus Methylomirabilales bacterium]|nr:methyl-accepting chemotaxis protein [candidate division NC10 bacterium]MCZ6551795.1 methyl-accepting chemotaxis protein [candidate division NC10 bacterium]MEC4667978.1 methyl-accepting chemotaxis protein [Nitrospirota bacterium]
MAMRPYRRRRILIDRFQYRLLVINLLYFCTILLIFATALFLPLILQLNNETISIIEQTEAASQFLSLHARVWPALLLVFVLLAFHSIFVSHRIVGPLYRFRTTFQAVAGGDLSVRATLRKHDYLEKESDVLNEMIGNLQSRVKGMKEHYEEVRAQAIALERAIASGSIEDMNKNLEGLRGQMERLKVVMDQFRIDPDETRGEDELATPGGSTSTREGSAPLTRV